MNYVDELTGKVSVTTFAGGDGTVNQETNILGKLTREFRDVKAGQAEEAIRKQLIALGWAPPETWGAVRVLIYRWRNPGDDAPEWRTDYTQGIYDAQSDCAEELEAALFPQDG